MNLAEVIGTSDRNRLFWRLQWIGWSFTLVFGAGMLIYWPFKAAILLAVYRALIGFLLSSFVLRPALLKLRQKGHIFSKSGIALIILLCCFLGLGDSGTAAGLAYLTSIDINEPEAIQYLLLSILLRSMIYIAWTLLYFGITYRLDTEEEKLRIAQKEAAIRASELQVLRGQVNPHFLFNALNSILAESGNPASVQRITLALAEYLRFSLRQQDNVDLLGKELTALESYLRLEKTRFEEKLEYIIEADDSARTSLAPVALVQPLLENAIKYGQLSNERPLRIKITCSVKNDRLQVSVSNTGQWVEPGSRNSTGIGLPNLRRRLELLYGDQASLDICTDNRLVEIRTSLPHSTKKPSP